MSTTQTVQPMTFQGFVDKYHLAIADAVLRDNEPIYNAAARADTSIDLSVLKRRPMMAQADAIRAGIMSVRAGNVLTTVVGEMGVGKSLIGGAIAGLVNTPGAKIILCPPHLVNKWRDELKDTLPDVDVVIARSVDSLKALPVRSKNARPLFVIVNREKAKLGYGWHPVTLLRWHVVDGQLQRDPLTRQPRKIDCCPTCWTPLVDDEGIPLSATELNRRPRKCDKCGGPLWSADKGRDRKAKQALADYIYERMPDYFDLLIVDECHEYKGGGSAQGMAAASLASACGRILALTGTLLGGYASTLFYLLYRFSPEVRAEFGWKDEMRWVRRYGFLERVTKRKGDDFEAGRVSKRRQSKITVRERPGVTPHILYQLIGNTVFVRLADVSDNLPDYTEHIEVVQMQGHDTPKHLPEYRATQSGAYEHLQSELRSAVKDALARGSKRLLGAYLQALLAWPDACHREETVIDPIDMKVIGHAPALRADVVYPKERAMLDRIKSEKAAGRKVAVYWTHTGTRDAMERFAGLCRAEGLRVAVLRSGHPAPEKRMDWINDQVKLGIDVLLTNPRLVQTGLDLLDFPTLVWAECDYSTFVLRQASRRSWRIGQKRPVHIYFMVYGETMQADALSLIAAKLRASLMVEGEIAQAGLAAHETSDDDLMVALARKLTAGGRVDSRSLEALFASNRAAEKQDTSLLVDAAWHSAVAETVPVCVARPNGGTVLPLGEITADLLDLPLFAAYGDGAVTGAVAVPVSRPRVPRGARSAGTVALLNQLGLWDAA